MLPVGLLVGRYGLPGHRLDHRRRCWCPPWPSLTIIRLVRDPQLDARRLHRCSGSASSAGSWRASASRPRRSCSASSSAPSPSRGFVQAWLIGNAQGNVLGMFFGRPISLAIAALALLTLFYPRPHRRPEGASARGAPAPTRSRGRCTMPTDDTPPAPRRCRHHLAVRAVRGARRLDDRWNRGHEPARRRVPEGDRGDHDRERAPAFSACARWGASAAGRGGDRVDFAPAAAGPRARGLGRADAAARLLHHLARGLPLRSSPSRNTTAGPPSARRPTSPRALALIGGFYLLFVQVLLVPVPRGVLF